ncbi:MAG: hypothetical protein ACI85Q_001573 [Salibacteraceae bacterium]|jgi:hypothetical protein
MKKILTILTVLLISAGSASAQYYMLPFINAGQNPGGLNTDDENPGTTGSTDVLTSGSLDWSAAQTIPFSFDFNGNTYNSLYVAPNGVVSFTASSGVGPGLNSALPSTSIPDNSICAWGFELSGGNDAVVSKTYGASPNRQYWLTWASASWTQGTGWAYWSIVLEEGSNNVYIVDQRNYVSGGSGVSLTAGLQLDGSSAISVPGSPALAATNEATGGNAVDQLDNSYYAFMYGTQPDYDASMSNIDMPSYIQMNQGGADVQATLTNLGAQTITDLELTYTIDGGTPVVASLSGLNIASGTSASVMHPTTWNPAAEGNYTIEFWASMINGNADVNNANDKTDNSVIAYASGYDRTVLYETFTSSTCGPCVAGNANFESVISGIPSSEYASIKYQMSWPGNGDPYNTADGNVRRTFYQISAVPGMEIDGGWDGNSGSFNRALHDDALAVPAFVSVWAEYNVDVSTNTITTCAIVEAVQDMGDATLHMAIKEHETFQNTGTNGETEFKDVLKKMAPGPSGSSITIVDGMREKVCVSYTFEGNFRLPNNSSDLINDATEHSVEEFTDLGVVVWVQQLDKTVLNATNAIATPLSVSNARLAANEVSVYPNPASDNAVISINVEGSNAANVVVMDIVGKTVINLGDVNLGSGKNNVNLNTSKLNGGVYLVQVTIDGVVSTQQLVIQK